MSKSPDIKSKYKVVIHPDDPTPGAWAIELLVPEYRGVIISFNKVKYKAENENRTYKFDYERHIHIVPKNIRKKMFPDEEKEAFEQLVGDVLIDIVDDYFQQNAVKEIKPNEHE